MTPHPIAITGMHRSGTSMITRGLHDSGLHLLGEGADEFIATADDNPEGFWENKAIVACNDDLLEATGGAWDNPPALPPQALDDPRVAHVADPASAALAGLRAHDHWGFKDPRLCLTAAFWLDLQPDLRFIVCLRHPLEVALSLKRRNQTSYSLGLALWERYYTTILELVPSERRIVTHYDSLFDDPDGELARLCDFAGLTPSSLFVRTDLRHHTVGVGLGEAAVSQSLVDLYRSLSREAGVVPPREAPVDEGHVRRLILDGSVAQRHAEQRQAAIERLQEREQEHVARIRQLERELTSAKLETGTRAKALHAETMRTVRELAESSSRTAAATEQMSVRHEAVLGRLDDRTRATAARVETVVKLSQPSLARRALRRVVRRPARATLLHVVRPGRRLVADLRGAGSTGREATTTVGSPAVSTSRAAPPSGRPPLRRTPPRTGGRARVVVVRVVRRGARTMAPPARVAARRLPPPAQDVLRRAARSGTPAVHRRVKVAAGRLPSPAQRALRRGAGIARRSGVLSATGAGRSEVARPPVPRGLPAKEWHEAYERMVAASVPSGERWLVAMPGSPNKVQRAQKPPGIPFPSGKEHSEELDDLSYVAILEAQRFEGQRHLVVPEGSRPWFVQHAALRAHVTGTSRTIVDLEHAGTVFGLTHPPRDDAPRLSAVITDVARVIGDVPAVLDWTETGVQADAPGVTMFRPPECERLPYADASIDVVVVDATQDRTEAARVASACVILVAGGSAGSSVLSVEMLVDVAHEDTLRCLLLSADPTGDERWRQTLAARASQAGAELRFAPIDHGAFVDLTEHDVVVVVEPYVVPLPDSIERAAALVAAHPTAGLAAKVVSADGRLHAAGGTIFSDRSSALIANGCADVSAPWHDFTRPVCWAPGMVAASASLWRDVAPPEQRSGRDLVREWCSAVWASGRDVRYQPTVTAVRLAPGGDEPSMPVDGSAWQRVLDLRPRRPPQLTDGAWRHLLAHDDVGACRA